MKEVKFRAKNEFGYWVKGDLHLNSPYPHIHTDNGVRVIIDTKTIGQFTGLYSAKLPFLPPAIECYFGDIVRFCDTEGNVYIKEVRIDERLHSIHFGNMSYEYMYNSGYFQPSKIEFEIIGNIHDNPELIK